MPIKYHIDPDRRLVIGWLVGTTTVAEMFDYAREVWVRPEVAGFDEVIDTGHAEVIENPTPAALRTLAARSAVMAATVPKGRLVIVARQQVQYGLGRMYEVYRGQEPGRTQEVAVFRTLAEASAFLGTDVTAAVPPKEPPPEPAD
ncbi:hypothetical protein [Gemmata sp.]|uniref:hypothetical protein n=1 Tax=Gemmata sp. TaxID=1914242 RepID=UPI003F720A10